MAASVREKQTVALKRMLNFNAPPLKNTAAEPVWKVLIYDRFGQDIISPLLSVKELRDMGITLHLLLHSDRDPIPDVPAIYFVMPTEENIDRICQDLRNQLYEAYYLNFISAISRSKLEDIASAALAANAVCQVTKVYDQYLNFITLEDDMFVLCHQNKELISYHAINRADIQDTDMEAIMDTIVDSLFCFFVTLGAVPIIRCPRGNAAEMVAVKLDKKLRENLRDARNSLFTGDNMAAGQFSFQRPLFVLADRNVDLATPLHHTWTYQALIHDVLDFQLNRVVMEEGAGAEPSPAGARPKKKNRKAYDLTAADKFWQKHKGSPFPEVAESVQEELDTYRAQEDEVKRLKCIMGLEGEDEGAISMLSDNTAKLTSAVSSLPELLEKKRLIDLHTNVATQLSWVVITFLSLSLCFLSPWRKRLWRPVAGCLELTAGQTCNLTRAFKDPFSNYRARVQAFTATRMSSWTVSGGFLPVKDTVLGPPDASVSGCGNCLLLQLRLPATGGLQQHQLLKDLTRELVFHVQRTRDGAQFSLRLPYKEEIVITYLQPGVEYCVTVSVNSGLNSNPVSSDPYCAFTSPPPPRSSLYLVFGLLGAFCALGFLLIGLVVCDGQLSFKLLRQRLPRPLSYFLLQGQNPSEGSADCLLMAHSPDQLLRSSAAGGEEDCGLAAQSNGESRSVGDGQDRG